MGELHSDFGGPIVIDHDVISDLTVATAEKVKDKWSGLLHGLKRQIEKWERSGQGDGGYIDDDAFGDDEDDETRPAPKFGELSNRSQGALDSRAVFLGTRNPICFICGRCWRVMGSLYHQCKG